MFRLHNFWSKSVIWEKARFRFASINSLWTTVARNYCSLRFFVSPCVYLCRWHRPRLALLLRMRACVWPAVIVSTSCHGTTRARPPTQGRIPSPAPPHRVNSYLLSLPLRTARVIDIGLQCAALLEMARAGDFVWSIQCDNMVRLFWQHGWLRYCIFITPNLRNLKYTEQQSNAFLLKLSDFFSLPNFNFIQSYKHKTHTPLSALLMFACCFSLFIFCSFSASKYVYIRHIKTAGRAVGIQQYSDWYTGRW